LHSLKENAAQNRDSASFKEFKENLEKLYQSSSSSTISNTNSKQQHNQQQQQQPQQSANNRSSLSQVASSKDQSALTLHLDDSFKEVNKKQHSRIKNH
jgi:hypothetical protein